MKKYIYFFFLFFIPALLIAGVCFAQTEVVLDQVGSGTWYPPPGCTSFYVQVWGGGGGGNGLLWGGGGASCSVSTIFIVTDATRASGYTYTIGAGGGNKQDGQDSRFDSCKAYRGLVQLQDNQPPQRYLPNSYIASSFVGGMGGKFNFTPPNQSFFPAGGGSAYPDKNGQDASGSTFGAGEGDGGHCGEDPSKCTNGNAPGGGAAVNNTGGRGEIRIFYYCDYKPGSISNAHTVPYPRELASDIITSTSNPTSPTYTFSWQSSTDSISWVTAAGSSNSSTYAIPEISTSTYYRRAIGGCGNDSNNITKPVLIKVFSSDNVVNGSPSKNGTITGYVRSKNGTGVSGITVQAKKNIDVKGSPASFVYSTVTDGEGKYKFANIFYGDKDAPSSDAVSVPFTITPLKPNHQFDPASYTPVPVSYNNYNVPDGPIFKDTTVLAVTGKVYQRCTGCLNLNGEVTDTIESGVDSARITGGDLTAYTLADGSGHYSTTVQDPGIKTFVPGYRNHQFSPAFISENIADNASGRNFMDTSTRTISGRLTDGGGEAIGSAVLEFYDSIKGRTTPAFRKRVSTDDSGYYTVSLPARPYRLRLVDFKSAYADVFNPRYLPPSEVVDFFNNKVRADSLYRNLDSFNAILNPVFHRKPVVQLTGLADTSCPRTPPLGIVFQQNVPRPFAVTVFEGDPGIGFRVVTLDQQNSADSLSIGDSVRLRTDLQDQTGVSPPVYISYRLKNGRVDTTITAGVPNIIAPFNRVLSVYYTDRYGRAAEIITRNALTTGIQAPPQTFVTVAPEMPQVILHRPPGDQSYSFWNQDQTITTTQRTSVALGGSYAAYVEAKVGSEFNAGIGVEIKTKTGISIKGSLSTTITNTTQDELTYTNTTSTKYSTKAGGIAGSAGDVYIGGAMNYKYGISNVVAFTGGCQVALSERLIIAPTGFATTFTYSEDHIVNTLMPALTYFVEKTTGAQRENYKNQLNVWQQVINNNKAQKQNAKFIENRSFDGNSGGVEVSKTITTSATNSVTFNVAIEESIALKLGFEVNGSGLEGGVTIGLKQEIGTSKVATNTTATTTGFLLQDQNAGDYYSVDIKEDRVYGTPVFALVAGTSSCPPEPGAQSRDNPRIIIDQPEVNNIPLTGKGFFTIKAVNQSESRETRNYKLMLNNATSNGLTIRKDGVALGGSDFIPINNLAYLEARDVLISVEKTNPDDKIFSYPDVQFILSDNCTGDVEQTNTITANFVTPCGSINLQNPGDNWVSNASANNIFPITFDGYNQASIDSVTLQYARQGFNNWLPAFTLKKLQITDLNSTTYPWNTGTLPDSLYKLRLKLVCSGGNTIYTPAVNGIIDRNAPFLITSPQPADKSFVNGDEISFTYNENLNTAALGSANVQLTRLSNYSDIAATVGGFNNKVEITPLTDLSGYAGDSIRVIVKNIADVYGNIKPAADTSYFLVGIPAAATGAPPVKMYTVNDSVLENSNGVMEIHFRLPAPATHITRVNFMISGTAGYLTDYTVSSDTLQRVFRDKNNNQVALPVLSYFNGSNGYINIDSLASEAILRIIPVKDKLTEQDETVRLDLSFGGDYTLADSTSATVTIVDDDVTIAGNGPFTFCPGDSVTLSVQQPAEGPPIVYTSYRWSPGGATTPTLKVKTGGLYGVVVTKAGGLSLKSELVQVVVNPVTVDAGSSLSGLCPGVATPALNGKYSGATGAVWTDGGAGGTFTNNSGKTPESATYTPSAVSNGNITLTLTSKGGCFVKAFKQIFVNGQSIWLGKSRDWEFATNWSNGVVPASCTSVIIPAGTPFMPLIRSNSSCYKLTVQPGAKVNIGAGSKLLITGNN